MTRPIEQRILKPGVVIDGKYRVDKAVARGGFSVIYRGTHIEMRRPVALKILQLGDHVQAAWLERFSREAQLASQLTHPNTVTVFDYGHDERGFLYLTMEWVDGVSLFHRFAERGALEMIEVARIAKQILGSLAEAHGRGILHRDLKPSNIMLSHQYDGQPAVKLLDFGIAKTFKRDAPDDLRITHEGGFVGTPRYASPEQLAGHDLTPAADIYCVGLIMWEALIGDPAVSGVHYGECVKIHTSPEPWQLPVSHAFPPELTRIVETAMQKDRSLRYTDATAMRKDLSRWLNSEEARDAEHRLSDTGGYFAVRNLSEPTSDPAHLPGAELLQDASIDASTGKKQSAERSPANPPPLPPEARGPSPQREVSQLENDAQISTERQTRPKRAESPTALKSSDPQADVVPRLGDGTPSASPLKPALRFGAVLAAAFLAGGIAVLAFTSGAQDHKEEQPTVVVSTGPGETEPVELREPSEFAASSPEAEDAPDGTVGSPSANHVVDEPTTSTDAILLAVRRSGWRQQGALQTLELEDGDQHSTLFLKGANSVAVLIFEASDQRMAQAIVADTAEDQVAVRFGKNVVRLRPAGGPGKVAATQRLAAVLDAFKKMLREER